MFRRDTNLEQKLKRELHNPRWIRIGDKPKRRAINVPVGRLELSMIKCVKQLYAKLSF